METNNHGETPDAVSPSVSQPTALSATAQPAYAQTFFRKLNRTRSKRNGYVYSANKIADNISEAMKFVEQAQHHNVDEKHAKVLFSLASKTLSGFRLKQTKE